MERRGDNFYKVLEVQSSATDIEIRRSYLRLSRQWHPDKAHQNGITVADATAQFQLISVAYETLADQQARRKYDIQLRRRQVPQDFGGFGFNFCGAQASTWSGFNSGGSTFGFGAQHDASTSSTMTAGGAWKAFIRNRISEEEFIRHLRNSFSSFEDGPNSFYDVFEKLFKDIFATEKDVQEPPHFGTGATSWKNGPGPFYRYWTRFHTTQKLESSESSSSRSVAKSSSGAKQAHRSQAKKQQKALHDAYNGKVYILVDLLQTLDPRVKAEELRQEKRAEEQHSENVAKLQAEREQHHKELAAERAARRRREDEESEEQNITELDDDLGSFGSGGACLLVITPDGLVMTCEQAVAAAAAAQDATRVFKNRGSVHDDSVERHVDLGEGGKVLECAAESRESESREHVCCGSSPEADSDMEGSEPEVYQCEACRKYFKHVNQYEVHLASKKHKKAYSAWLAQQQK